MDSINITNLCEILKTSLPKNNFKVIGQINQIKISQGHVYFTLKDDMSSIKAIIWKSKYNTKIKLNEGDKITVKGKFDYYGLNGTISFVIDSIIENEGIGELQKQYDLIKNDFYNKGYFNKENKLEIPNIIKNILILTSLNGAAIHDFLFNLKNNKSKIIYEIIDVPVQGIDNPRLIIQKLNELNNQKLNYDLIVISRGGGSFQDLFGFSDPLLLETVNNFKKIPILSAIGHQVDNPLLDLVADCSCPTPSLAAQYIVDINKQFLINLNELKNEIKNSIINDLFEKQKALSILKNYLKISFNEIKNITNNFKNLLYSELDTSKIKLEFILKSLNDPHINLLDLNYKLIINENDIKKDNTYILSWNNKNFKIKIL